MGKILKPPPPPGFSKLCEAKVTILFRNGLLNNTLTTDKQLRSRLTFDLLTEIGLLKVYFDIFFSEISNVAETEGIEICYVFKMTAIPIYRETLQNCILWNKTTDFMLHSNYAPRLILTYFTTTQLDMLAWV